MASVRFFRCSHCGNIVELVHTGGGTLTCCDTAMTELKANTTDAATEKHVPAVTRKGHEIHVQIGSVEHPMLPEHYIQFIVLETAHGVKRVNLKAGDKPVAVFTDEDEPVAVYEFCNLHGLWKYEL